LGLARLILILRRHVRHLLQGFAVKDLDPARLVIGDRHIATILGYGTTDAVAGLLDPLINGTR